MSYTDAGTLGKADTGKRMRVSRQRLADSDMAGQARAWRLWAACIEATASWHKGSDRIHVVVLANMAGMRDDKASPILREFDRLGIFGWVKDKHSRKTGLLSLPGLQSPDLAPDESPEAGAPPENTGIRPSGAEAPPGTKKAQAGCVWMVLGHGNDVDPWGECGRPVAAGSYCDEHFKGMLARQASTPYLDLPFCPECSDRHFEDMPCPGS